MSVQLNPSDQIQFNRPFNREVCCMLTVANHNAEPVAFRIKTTAPKLYDVRPNSGRIEPGGSVDVQVLLQPMRPDPPLSELCKDGFLVESVVIPPRMEFRTAWHWWNFVVDSDKKAFQVSYRRIRVVYLPPESQMFQEASVSQVSPTADEDVTSSGLESLLLPAPSPRPASPHLPLPAPEMDPLSLVQDLDTESAMPDVIQHMPSPARSTSVPLPTPPQTQGERKSSVPVIPVPGSPSIAPSTSSPNPLPTSRHEREREHVPPPLRLPPPRSRWLREERVPNKERRIHAPKEKGEEGLAGLRGSRGRGSGFVRQHPERKPIPAPIKVAPSLSPTPPPRHEHRKEPLRSLKLEDPGEEKTAPDNMAIESLKDEPLRQPDLEDVHAVTPSSPPTPGSASTPDILATVVPSPVSPAPLPPLWGIPSPPSSQRFDADSNAPDDDVHISSPTPSLGIPLPPPFQTEEEWSPPFIPSTPASPPIPSIPLPPPGEREGERKQSPIQESTIIRASVAHNEAIDPLKGEPPYPHQVVDIGIFLPSGPPTPDSVPFPEPLLPVAPSLMLPTPSTPPQLRPFDMKYVETESFDTKHSTPDDPVCVPPVGVLSPPQLQTPERSPSVPPLYASASPVIVPSTRASTPSPPPRRERERKRPLPSFPRPRIREERVGSKEPSNQAHAERSVGPSAGLRVRGTGRALEPGIGRGRGQERERGGRPAYVPRYKLGVGTQGGRAAVPGTPVPGPARPSPQRERERGRQLPSLRLSSSPPLRALSEPSLSAPGPPVPTSPRTAPSTPSPTPSPPPR
ncbi:phosphatidylinositol-binding protein scs2, partial [Ceratobasidium sp. 370]